MHIYSLAHLADIATPPPSFIRAAAAAGYDAVSLRILGREDDHAYDIAHDKAMMDGTRKALEETGLKCRDAELIRITDDFNAEECVPSLEAAATLGIEDITLTIPSRDREARISHFRDICRIASRFSMKVNLEPIIWSGIPDIIQARQLLERAGQPNAGLLIDIFHFHHSGVSPEEIRRCPQEWFTYVHMCDCFAATSRSIEDLQRDGLSRRACPGEGVAGIKKIMNCIPDHVTIPVVLEIPNKERLGKMGLEGYARLMLDKAKACLE